MRNSNIVGILCEKEKMEIYFKEANLQNKQIIMIKEEVDVNDEVITSIINTVDKDGQLLLIVDKDIALNKSNLPELLEVNWKHK